MNAFDVLLFTTGLFVNTARGVCHFTSSLVREGVYAWNNHVSRGVRNMRRTDEENLLSYAGPNGSVMISGGTDVARERLETALVRLAHDSGRPVIILHRGNSGLEQRVAALPNAVICNQNMRRYDPFREFDTRAIADILLDNLPRENAYGLNIPQAKSYVRGLAEFYLNCNLQNRRPSLNSLYDCTDITSKGYMRILAALQSFLAQGTINQQVHDVIKSLLDNGQSQENALNDYLGDTLRQLSSCTPPLRKPCADSQYVSLRRAIERNAILCLDTGSISDQKIFYNLFVNELNHCQNQQLASPYLILDGITLKSSPAFITLLESQNSPAHCIACQNVYTSIDDGRPGSPLFNSLAAGCAMNITLNQPNGYAAELWSAYYGTYQRQRRNVAYNHGTAVGHGAQLLPGANNGTTVGYNDVDERVFRPDEFTRLSDLGMICAIQAGGVTQCIKTRLTPEP